MSSERMWHSSLLCHYVFIFLLIRDHSSYKYSRTSTVNLSLGNIADVYLISSVLWVRVRCTSAENGIDLFSRDTPPGIFYSITFPFPNAGEAIFKQMGNRIKDCLQRKNKGSGNGLMWAHCREVGAGVQVGKNCNQRRYGEMK